MANHPNRSKKSQEPSPAKRAARRVMQAQALRQRQKAQEKIVPDNVEPGSKEHLERLSSFFGI